MTKYKTIRIYNDSFQKMTELCRKYELQKTEIVEAFLDYFEKTGIDPRDPSDVTSEVRKLKNQLISFIKTQEKEKLNPMVAKVDISTNKLREFIEDDVSYEKTKELIRSLVNFLDKKFKEQEQLLTLLKTNQ